jgi:cysteine-rich repeat protein
LLVFVAAACLVEAARSAVVRGAHPLQRSGAIRALVDVVCGDGLVEGAEACDDGNTAASDGCSATCTVEAGWACTGSPSICSDDPEFSAPLLTDLVDDVAGATVTFARATAATQEVWAADCSAATLSTVAGGTQRHGSRCVGTTR